jgi:hypothetical protein
VLRCGSGKFKKLMVAETGDCVHGVAKLLLKNMKFLTGI